MVNAILSAARVYTKSFGRFEARAIVSKYAFNDAQPRVAANLLRFVVGYEMTIAFLTLEAVER